MKHFFSKKRTTLIFFMMIAAQMFSYNYSEYLNMEPRSIHSWRQADCVSFALNFYHNRTSFLEPGVSNLGRTGDGKIASDFPLIQYAVAQIWKVTDVNITIFRLVDLFFLTLGLFYCFKLFAYWFNEHNLLALLLTGIVYSSTILAYYGPTTLSDIQAFGLSCTGFYFFVLWLDKKLFRYLTIASVLFLFAGLLKMSSAFIYTISLAYYLVRLYYVDKEDRQTLFSFKILIILSTPFVAWFAWYYHVHLYNQIHHNEFFLIGVLPAWTLEKSEFYRRGALFLENVLPAVFNIYLLLFLCLVTIVSLLTNIKSFLEENYLRLLIPVLVLVCYMTLFFEVFSVHDYYLINMMPVFIIVVGLLVKRGLESYPFLFKGYYFITVLMVTIVVLTYETSLIVNLRIGSFDKERKPSLFVTQKEFEYFQWNNWFDRSRYGVLETITEHTLDSLGITKEKQVMCMGDFTINRGLCLIDRLGYSSYEAHADYAHTFIEKKKRTGLKYLILTDPSLLNREKLRPYFKNKIYEEKETSIYKL